MSSKILTALFLVGGASALYAGPVYSCGGGSACDGNLYAVWVVSQTATSYVLDVGVQVTNNYLTANGGPGSTTDRIDALAIIPDNNGSFTNASLTVHPGGMWSLQNGGLNSGGCSGSGAPYVCAGSSNMGAMLFTYNPITNTNNPNTLLFQFTITGTPRLVARTLGSGGIGNRWTCPDCGVWICGDAKLDRLTGIERRIVRGGTFDDRSWIKPNAHIWTRSAQPWVVIPKDVPSYLTNPGA